MQVGKPNFETEAIKFVVSLCCTLHSEHLQFDQVQLDFNSALLNTDSSNLNIGYLF